MLNNTYVAEDQNKMTSILSRSIRNNTRRSLKILLWLIHRNDLLFQQIQFSKRWMRFATSIFVIFVMISSALRRWMQEVTKKIKANVQNAAIGMISKFQIRCLNICDWKCFSFDIKNKDTSKPYPKQEFFVSAHH